MNRRRSYDDEDEQRSHKRRRISSEPKDIEDRLESLIMRVGEKSTSSLESNLEGLAGVLEADLPSYKGNILRILGECVVKMPEKITIYTTLIGLLNARNYNFGGECVELLTKNMREALRGYHFDAARTLVRFFSDLVNCHVISAGSLINLFETMIEVTHEESIPQVRSDWYVYAVLGALPWVGRELYEKKDQELDHLLKTIDAYTSKRKKMYLKSLRVWSTEVPHPQEDYLDCLWAQIVKLRSDKWIERHITRPYLAFDNVLCEALQHNLPTVTPPPHQEDTIYPYPTVIFRMFDYTDCPEGPILPGSHAIERFLIEEPVRRIIQQYYLDRKDCAAQLLMFPGKQKIPLDYVITEVILSKILMLPSSPQLEIAYGSLLIELCKLQPSSMPQVLAQAVELVYERIENMNIDCIERFSSWFAYHLSNFQFRWSWSDWTEAVNLDPLHPKPIFITETLQKCLRLSYHSRIAEVVTEPLLQLLPPPPEPDNKYKKDETNKSLPGMATADQLEKDFEAKASANEILLSLCDISMQVDDSVGGPVHDPLKIEVFVHMLLSKYSQSFSHSFAAIAKYHSVFKSLASTEEAQMCILKSIFELWHNHQQMICVLVDKLLKIEIVECCAVANWIFSKDMAPEFNKFYIWTILHSTIRKMIKNTQRLQSELERAKTELDKMSDDDDDEENEERRPKKKIEVTDEMVEQMEDQLESAQSDQKNLFLVIFQRFIMILTEHIARCEMESKDFKDHWFHWTIGRLQQIFHQHHDHVFKYVTTLESLLFTSDVDVNVLSVFQQFCALRE